MRETILQLDHVHCSYDTRPVLNGASLTLLRGQTALLAGPNGCGKSTLLKAVIGVLPLTKGEILFEGHSQRQMTPEARINSGIGYLRQTNNIFPGLTVRENLALSGLSLSRRTLDERVSELLATFGLLADVLDRRAGTLSGGQRQALAIGMVILHPRRLYLLDEPTAGLSPKAAVSIMDCVRDFATGHSDISVLMVEHRLELLEWIDRAFVLIQGNIQVDTKDMSVFRDSEWLASHYF